MQRLAFFFLAPVLVATLGTTGAVPSRPADGTYTYAIAGTPAVTSSTIVVRTDGASVSTIERLAVAGTTILAKTDYLTSSLTPSSYRAAYGAMTLDISFAGATATALSPPATFRAAPGSPVLAPGDGLIAYVAMLPSMLAAHPGAPVSYVSLNEGGKIVTIASVAPVAARPSDVSAADVASAAVESPNGAHFDLWTNPQTHAVDAADVGGIAIRLSSRTAATVAETPAPPAAVATPYPMSRAHYRDRDVAFGSSGSATIAGTLSIPAGGATKRFPAFVFVHGSGPGTRDGGDAENPTFLELGNALANYGFAVLRYDKRGIGKSTGTATESWKVLGGDARAAVAFLRSQPDVDPHRIYLLGHSEGGEIVPLIAPSIHPALAGIVLLAGPAVSMGRILDEQSSRMSAGMLPKLQAAFRDYDGLEPTTYITKVTVPMLVLQGSRDLQVLPKDLPPLVAAARKAHRTMAVAILDGDDHLFIRLDPSHPDDFSEDHVPAPIDPRVANYIEAWAAVTAPM